MNPTSKKWSQSSQLFLREIRSRAAEIGVTRGPVGGRAPEDRQADEVRTRRRLGNVQADAAIITAWASISRLPPMPWAYIPGIPPGSATTSSRASATIVRSRDAGDGLLVGPGRGTTSGSGAPGPLDRPSEAHPLSSELMQSSRPPDNGAHRVRTDTTQCIEHADRIDRTLVVAGPITSARPGRATP